MSRKSGAVYNFAASMAGASPATTNLEERPLTVVGSGTPCGCHAELQQATNLGEAPLTVVSSGTPCGCHAELQQAELQQAELHPRKCLFRRKTMQCPNCHAEYLADDLYCRHCGADLTAPSTSLVPTHTNLPAVIGPQLPRVAAGVGALAVGFGLELLRRNLLARLTRSSRSLTNVADALPTLNGLQDILVPQNNKPSKLPKGYEIHETVVYLRRVIRRED